MIYERNWRAKRKWAIGLCSMIFIAISLLGASITLAEGNVYEKPGQFQASAILKPELLKGKYHTVQENVINDGLFNHYTVESQFGVFQSGSTNSLKILVHEINAIAAMKQVEVDDTVMSSMKKSGENTLAGIQNLITDPQGTVEGAASGVGSLFNRAKVTVGNRKPTSAEDSRLEQFIGLSKAKGEIASKYGVNMYSRNSKLQEELDRLAQADYLGGLGVGVATSFIPGVGGLILSTSGTARLLNEAINTTPASELWLQNQKKLLAMGMDGDTVELFLNNPSFSPAMTTVLVTALDSMAGVENRELFVKVSLQASTPDMAKTITEIAVMSAGYHKEIAPLKSFASLARVTMGIRKDMTRVILLPIDYLIWNKRIADVANDYNRESKGKSFEIWSLGTLSKKSTSEFQKLAWKIHIEAGPRLIPKP